MKLNLFTCFSVLKYCSRKFGSVGTANDPPSRELLTQGATWDPNGTWIKFPSSSDFHLRSTFKSD